MQRVGYIPYGFFLRKVISHIFFLLASREYNILKKGKSSVIFIYIPLVTSGNISLADFISFLSKPKKFQVFWLYT